MKWSQKSWKIIPHFAISSFADGHLTLDISTVFLFSLSPFARLLAGNFKKKVHKNHPAEKRQLALDALSFEVSSFFFFVWTGRGEMSLSEIN